MEVQEVETFEEDFEPRVLESSELSLVAGGLVCTCNTYQVCHVDGTTD